MRDEIAAGDMMTDPLSLAVDERDRSVVEMVEQALDENKALLAYQPVVAAGRNVRPAFYEGLIRVLDKTGRIIPARQFIHEVEQTETGRRIDALSLKLGLEALHHHPELRLSVNLSARSIEYPPWMRILNDNLQSDPNLGERLILEITEGSAIASPRLVARFIAALQDRGIAFAIDDFGSGYTSMRYLKDFCFDVLKMDGEFCRGVATNPDNRALVKAMISIGRHFDMLTVAECVEAQEDAVALVNMGVDCLQGYLYGAPTTRPRWGRCPIEVTG